MIFDRQQQHLLLEGKEYTPEDIARFIAGLYLQEYILFLPIANVVVVGRISSDIIK